MFSNLNQGPFANSGNTEYKLKIGIPGHFFAFTNFLKDRMVFPFYESSCLGNIDLEYRSQLKFFRKTVFPFKT